MKSIEIIEQAIDLAIQKGAYNLSDASVIINALNELKNDTTNRNSDNK